jgi:hypothetical protein
LGSQNQKAQGHISEENNMTFLTFPISGSKLTKISKQRQQTIFTSEK